MANTDQTNIPTEHGRTQSNSTDTSPNENHANIQRNKRKLTAEQYQALTDKLLEIEDLECQEQLVHQRLHSINAEKQHLQNLLNLLQTMDEPGKIKYSRSRQCRSQKTGVSSTCD